jgi:hypothetical protein
MEKKIINGVDSFDRETLEKIKIQYPEKTNNPFPVNKTLQFLLRIIAQQGLDAKKKELEFNELKSNYEKLLKDSIYKEAKIQARKEEVIKEIRKENNKLQKKVKNLKSFNDLLLSRNLQLTNNK